MIQIIKELLDVTILKSTGSKNQTKLFDGVQKIYDEYLKKLGECIK